MYAGDASYASYASYAAYTRDAVDAIEAANAEYAIDACEREGDLPSVRARPPTERTTD